MFFLCYPLWLFSVFDQLVFAGVFNSNRIIVLSCHVSYKFFYKSEIFFVTNFILVLYKWPNGFSFIQSNWKMNNYLRKIIELNAEYRSFEGWKKFVLIGSNH